MGGLQLVLLTMVFVAILMFGFGINFLLKARQDEEDERLRNRLGLMADLEEEALSNLLRETAADGALDALGDFGARLQDTIRQSGRDLTVSQLVTQCLIAGALVGVGFIVLAGPQGVVMGIIAGFVPIFVLRRQAAKRAKDILAQMPDALEMMGRAMQTGAGLTDCFRLAQAEMSDPISSEFGRVADEVHFGKDWRTTLSELIKRNPSLFELRLFVSSVLLQREMGGNMIETFNRISKLIRNRYVFDAKVKAMTSEARASGFILAAMPVGVLVLVFVANAPYLYPLIDHPMGNMAVVYGVASYGTGIYLMVSMANVKV